MTWAQTKAGLATWKHWPWWRKCLFSGGLVLLTAVFLFLGYFFIFEPAKFSIFSARVRKAQTAAQEREVFQMAHEWGVVWELHVSDGKKYLFNSKEWPDLISGRTDRPDDRSQNEQGNVAGQCEHYTGKYH